MALLGYLQSRPLLYHDRDDANADSVSANGNTYHADTIPAPRNARSRQERGWLRPAAKILTDGVNLVNNTVLQLRDGLSEEQRAAKAKKEERRQILALRMKNAGTLEHWRTAARDLDILEDNEAWKYNSTSAEFDAPFLEARLKQLDEARTNCDVKLMLNLVRTTLSRDVGGMGSTRLYKHSHIGTKDLIERYIDSALDTIRALVETSKQPLPDGLETKDILEQVVCARQAFGRSALLLSGGATFGMNHIGVLKALFETKLLPRIISGASAGSIVCAVVCTRTDEEIPQVLHKFPFGNLSVFDDEGKEEWVLERMRRLMTEGAWIDIKHLIRVMKELLGDMTFQEAYNRTRRILNICVSSASVYELPRLLNYVTAPNVMIWSAVAASCSVPYLFSGTQLLVKDPITGENTPWNPTPQRWIDGSVDNDLPMTRLAEMFNVNHFIVSQVNPHIVPFLVKDETITPDVQPDQISGPGLVYTLTNLAKDEALHRLHVLAELGIFPNVVTKCRSILSQKYSGDITILPEIDYKDIPNILRNPTSEFMAQACLCGERATWPKLSRIRNHCAVELELDSAVQKLRARVVFSPSQVDLRRLTTSGSIRTSNKRGGRKRREGASVSQILQPVNRDIEADGSPKRKGSSRPPLQTASSYWGGMGRLPPTAPSHRSAHTTPLPTPRPGEVLFEPFKFPSPKKDNKVNLHLEPLDASSAGETSHSPPSSDADMNSHTDESSPEPDLSDTAMPGVGLYCTSSSGENRPASLAGAVDLFSGSQPVTPGTDHVLATSPARSRSKVGLAMGPTRKLGEREKKPDWKSATAPSSPEIRF